MKRRLSTLLTRAATAFLGLTLLVSAGTVAAPRPAEAVFGIGDIVLDPTNLIQNMISASEAAAFSTKEYVLDTLSWQVAKLAIQSMTKSLVNWINSGFQGSPAFVTDLQQNLQGVGDAVARQFFNELSNEFEINSPFSDEVLDAVRLGYYLSTSPESFYTRNPYTLNQVSADDRAFLAGDFSQGGWNAWYTAFMNPNNNPYGAQMAAEQALTNTIANATEQRVQELSWNRGFLSWRGECQDTPAQQHEAVHLSNEDECVSGNYNIETPGSIIMEQLNTTLGANVNQLVTADEFNEIIAALMNQLVGKILGVDGGGGFRSVSRPSSGGGSSFLDQATNPNQYTGGNDSISGNFSLTMLRKREAIEEYRTNWQRIETAARAALSRCPSTTNNPSPQQVIDRATAALAKAAAALTTLDELNAEMMEANTMAGDQSVALLEIATRFQNLLASSELPSTEEIAEAQVEAQDTGDAEPGSLYSQMNRLATEGCTSGD